ncbi:hypothetical protein [Roseovarius sp. MMSF_3281]|nr:hypothetical protein [Roseovarius sp. MMSF_3281]
MTPALITIGGRLNLFEHSVAKARAVAVEVAALRAEFTTLHYAT